MVLHTPNTAFLAVPGADSGNGTLSSTINTPTAEQSSSLLRI
jgi:hypothetical protein